MKRNIRILWIIAGVLLLIYLAGLALGGARTASWHLLLVITAILLLYGVISSRST